MSTQTKHTKRANHDKHPPLVYWANAGRFNLTALLQTGRFYLDESGLLVAPNGTRYRIPSGPPEGRKPLRPDRPIDGRSEIASRQGDLFSSEQQDSSKLGQWSLTKTPHFSNDLLSSSTHKRIQNVWNRTDVQMGKTTLLGPEGISQTSSSALTTQLNWNVILLTVILSSIALVCNLALVVFLSWKLNRFRKSPMHSTQTTSSQRGHSNPLVHFPSISNEVENLDRCHCLHSRFSSAADPTRVVVPGFNAKSGTCPAHMFVQDPRTFHSRLSRRYRSRRGRRRRRPAAAHRFGRGHQERDPLVDQKNALYTDPKTHILRTEMSLLGDLGPAAPFLNPMDRVEIGSSSGGSWHVVVSDGMISETTADEEDNNEENTTTGGDSATNSDILYRGSRHRIPSARWGFSRSDSTPEDIGRLTELGAIMNSNTRRVISMNAKRNHLDTIRSDRLPNSGDASSASHSEFSYSVAQCPSQSGFLKDISTIGTVQVSHSLGIHFGLLGIILSLIQLIVVCSALSRRMVDSDIPGSSNTFKTESYLSELVCVMATSLAADTLLCARQYVLAAIILVFWTTCYMALIGPMVRDSPQTALSSFCLLKSGGSSELDQGTNVPDDGRRQQRYAYLALTHSLPWAVAAGTALLITFALPSSVADIPSPGTQMKLNLFFHGLHSLLVCQVDLKHASRIKTESPSLVLGTDSVEITLHNISNRVIAVTHSAQHSLAWSLLILIPLCIHVLLCTIYAVIIRLGMQRCRGMKRLGQKHQDTGRIICCITGVLLALILLEYFSCAVPVVWFMFAAPWSPSYDAETTQTSSYIHRLILIHLLIDPWLICGLIRVIMARMITQLNQSVSIDRPLHSERVLRSWSHESPIGTAGRNSAYHSQSMDVPGRPSAPSNGLMSCLPVTNRLSTTTTATDSRGLAVQPNGQAMLMPCVPSTNFYVSPIQTLQHSTGMDTGLFVPLEDHAVRLSPSQSDTLTMGHFHPNPASLSMSMTFANPTRSSTLGPLSIVQQTSPPAVNADVFPQLCEHHQKLLEQHYAVRLPEQDHCSGMISSIGLTTTAQTLVTCVSSASTSTTTTSQSGQLRAFGQVPRINSSSLKFADSLLMKPIIRLTSDESCATIASVSERTVSGAHLVQSNYPLMEHSPGSEDTGKLLSGRPPGGKSQATAAVMAAAAAAVAAQAGTMSRASTEQHTPAGVDPTQSSPTSQQHYQQQSNNDLKKPLHHSNLSTTTNESLQRLPKNDLVQRD
ncbi:unnamed protein product [Echinostoma caproni]|uniref:RING-type domain-containing protein n=1 Tax=Echinostoma caproni TaxID=27848 RepID=A0A183A521_9TREM|nr:unnamed protein product [Echinostoma caproni]